MNKQKMLSAGDIHGEYLLISFERTLHDVFGWECFYRLYVDKSVLPEVRRYYNDDSKQNGVLNIKFSNYTEYLTLYRYLVRTRCAYILTDKEYNENIEYLRKNMKWTDGDADEIIWVNARMMHGYVSGSLEHINNSCELDLMTHSKVYVTHYYKVEDLKSRVESLDKNKYLREFMVSVKDNPKYTTAFHNYVVMYNYERLVIDDNIKNDSRLSNILDGIRDYMNIRKPYQIMVCVKYNKFDDDYYLVSSYDKVLKFIPDNKLGAIMDIIIVADISAKPKIGEYSYVLPADMTGSIIGKQIRSFFVSYMDDLYRVLRTLKYKDGQVFVICNRG